MDDAVLVPPCDTHCLFVDDAGRLAERPSLLSAPDSSIDESAVFSVLQFGAIVPPLSPWKGIRRLPPGYEYRDADLVGRMEIPRPASVASLDPQQQCDEVERILDRILTTAIGDGPDPVVLFSGGVDSGLIASRLATLGYRDTVLVNYCFGAEDPESKFAEAMAEHLGLRFERVLARRGPARCLTDPGGLYSMPFADPSTAAASDLAHAIVDRCGGEPHLILEGSGADAAFGNGDRIKGWQRVFRIPLAARKVASRTFDLVVRRREGMAERVSSVLRRSVGMPELSAMLSLNPLAGTLYSDSSREAVDGLLADWGRDMGGETLPLQLVAADMMLVSASTGAQMAQPIYESAGHTLLSPFLDTEVFATALVALGRWRMDELKAPLKRSLAQHVPPEMVYRTKMGFDDPSGSVFHDSEFIDYLRAAAEPSGPIASMLDVKAVREACGALSRGEKLAPQTAHCLWGITFTDRWYRTAQRGSRAD